MYFCPVLCAAQKLNVFQMYSKHHVRINNFCTTNLCIGAERWSNGMGKRGRIVIVWLCWKVFSSETNGKRPYSLDGLAGSLALYSTQSWPSDGNALSPDSGGVMDELRPVSLYQRRGVAAWTDLAVAFYMWHNRDRLVRRLLQILCWRFTSKMASVWISYVPNNRS